MVSIRTRLKISKTVLFTDGEYFNRDITGVKTLSDIKDMFSIKGDLKRSADYANCVQYKLVNSDYDFTLTFLN